MNDDNVLGFPYGNIGTDNGPVDPPSDVEPLDYPQEGYRLQHVKLPDPINPPHYKRNGVETIDLIEHIIADYKDPIQAGLVWQILKYLARAPHKGNQTDDLCKAGWYMERLLGKML